MIMAIIDVGIGMAIVRTGGEPQTEVETAMTEMIVSITIEVIGDAIGNETAPAFTVTMVGMTTVGMTTVGMTTVGMTTVGMTKVGMTTVGMTTVGMATVATETTVAMATTVDTIRLN